MRKTAWMAVDAALLGAAYLAAFALRFDFGEPPWGWLRTAQSYAVVCAINLASMWGAGCYGRPARGFGWRDVPRFFAAMLAAAAMLTAMRVMMPSVDSAGFRPPYSITIMSFVFGFAGVVCARLAVLRCMEACAESRALPFERAEKTFDNSVAARFLAGRTVMVTGAGGTIGSELVRQAAAAGAKKVVMVERCENALYEIDRRMRAEKGGAETVAAMADAGDAARMREIFAAHRPSVVLHAAACKHVPMVELNPSEGWRNNTEATRVLASVAAESGTERFVLISTDKAVNPVSVMGKTKRAAEEAVMSMPEGGTSFCAVRFGNVFGSSGSVAPLFREQIAAGGPVTVTHPDMRRYFMTVQEAVSLVLQAASRREKAIYTLDMGESVRIVDLAERMIRQAGLRPYADIPIVFTGMRPGEKLFEEIDVSEKSAFKTDMAKIYITRA